jgi:hypothetical protein
MGLPICWCVAASIAQRVALSILPSRWEPASESSLIEPEQLMKEIMEDANERTNTKQCHLITERTRGAVGTLHLTNVAQVDRT